MSSIKVYIQIVLALNASLIFLYSQDIITLKVVKTSVINDFQSVKFVSFSPTTFDSRRTGNQMFDLAALLTMASKTNRIPILPKDIPSAWLDKIFKTDLARMNNSFIYEEKSTFTVIEPGIYVYSPLFDNPNSIENITTSKMLLICGYFQSLKYVTPVENQLRHHLEFKNETIYQVSKFVNNSKSDFFSSFDKVSTIGIHIRRGDFILNWTRGYVVADESYIQQALNHQLNSLPANKYLVFVASDDIKWAKECFK